MARRAAFSLTEAALAGPRLIVREPLAYAAWVLVSFVQQRLYSAETLSTRTVIAAAQGEQTGIAVAGAALGFLVSLLFSALLTAAALRGLLRPEARAFAYLRLGPAEWRVLGLEALGNLVMLAVTVPVSAGISTLGAMAGAPLLFGQALTLGSLAGGLALVRFATAPALAVAEGRFDPGAAWRSTRGLFWRLALLLFVIAVLQRLLAALPSAFLRPSFGTPWLDAGRLAQEAWLSLVGPWVLAAATGVSVTAYRAGLAAQTPG